MTAQVVSRNGARTVGFEIDENHFANLMKADIKDAVYTASACANFQEQYRAEDVQGANMGVLEVVITAAMILLATGLSVILVNRKFKQESIELLNRKSD